jgi:hypothetical protein
MMNLESALLLVAALLAAAVACFVAAYPQLR